MRHSLLLAYPWVSVFEGDGSDDSGDPGDVGESGDADNNDDTSETAKTKTKSESENKKLFTQDEVNTIMADNKRSLQKKNQELIAQLEQTKKAGNLSTEERSKLNERIDALENEMLTKEELAKKEQDKLVRTHKKQVDELASELDNWKNRFTQSTITRSITDAAVKSNAFHPSQIVAIIQPTTRLVEDVDSEGQPTGELIPKVKFSTTDKDGKPVQLDVTVEEAVKQMKDMDEYLNLFKGDGTAGLGAGNTGGGKKPDVRALASDPAKYRQARKEGKI